MSGLVYLTAWNLLISFLFAAVIWLLSRTTSLGRRPALCHCLWLLVLVKLVTPPVIPLPVLPMASMSGGQRSPESAGEREQLGPADIGSAAASLNGESTTLSLEGQSDLAVTRSAHQVENAYLSSEAPSAIGRDAVNLPSGILIGLAVASLLGTGLLWTSAFRQFLRVDRLVGGASIADGRPAAILGNLAATFHKRPLPALVIVEQPIMPLLWAAPGRPTIVLPRQLADSLAEDQLRSVISHELAHLERRDAWAQLFALFVTGLQWWNPCAWLASREMRSAAEAACDALVMERLPELRKTYARSLLEIVDFVTLDKPLRSSLGVTFGESRSLRRRVALVTSGRTHSRISKLSWIALACLALAACSFPTRGGEGQNPPASAPPAPAATPAAAPINQAPDNTSANQKVTVATVESKPLTLTQEFLGQINAHRHIKIRALQRGYLEGGRLKEGQAVKAGDALFSVVPILYKAKLDSAVAEVRLEELEFRNAKDQFEKEQATKHQVLLSEAKVRKAQANADLAKAELEFATVRAPFDGIIDRLYLQQGSLVEEGETLTTLSDNTEMWAYFSVPESDYLEFKEAKLDEHPDELKIELRLANGKKFDQPGKLAVIEADFNDQNGSIPFRADFLNPSRLLRHGQRGTVMVSRVLPDAIAIPQQAIFEILGKRYVYVVDKDDVAHQRGIDFESGAGKDVIVKSGLAVGDKVVVDGVRQVHDGEKVKVDAK